MVHVFTHSGPAAALVPEVDEDACRWRGDLPHCPRCGRPARPNILMFGDWGWVSDRTGDQQHQLDLWRREVDRLAVLELGAGIHVPTVRWFGESLGVPLVRINPTEPEVASVGGVGLAMGALAGLEAIRSHLV